MCYWGGGGGVSSSHSYSNIVCTKDCSVVDKIVSPHCRNAWTGKNAVGDGLESTDSPQRHDRHFHRAQLVKHPSNLDGKDLRNCE